MHHKVRCYWLPIVCMRHLILRQGGKSSCLHQKVCLEMRYNEYSGSGIPEVAAHVVTNVDVWGVRYLMRSKAFITNPYLSVTLAMFLVVNSVLCDDTIGSLRREPGHKDRVSRHDQGLDRCGCLRNCKVYKYWLKGPLWHE